MPPSGPRYYYLGPWQWTTAPEGSQQWQAPPHTVGLVDLRPVAPNVQAVGFFSTDQPLNDSDYESFGDQLDGNLTSAQKSAWQSLLGLSDPLSSSTLLDVLWETLTTQADPDGNTRAKPLMPDSGGAFELHLGGHSLVKRLHVKGRDAHLRIPHWPQVQRVLQNDYRRIVAGEQAMAEAWRNNQKSRFGHKVAAMAKAHGVAASDLRDQMARTHEAMPAKWLGNWARKLRLRDASQVSDLLIPSDMDRIQPRQPSTTLSDDFNRSNESLDAGNWTELDGAWSLSGNKALADGSTASGDQAVARYDTALSSEDCFAQIYHDTNTDRYPSPIVRVPSGTADDRNGYLARARPSTDTKSLLKLVDGTVTSLASKAEAYSLPADYRVSADGSTIKMFIDGIEEALGDGHQPREQFVCRNDLRVFPLQHLSG